MPKLSDKRKEVLDKMMHNDICNAAVAIIKEKGLDALTMSKVAERADVSKGTLYNYFKDKDELLKHTDEFIFKPFFISLHMKINSNLPPLVKLEEVARIMLDHFDKYCHMIMLIHKDYGKNILQNEKRFRKREELITNVERVIQDGIEKGLFRDLPTRTASEIFLGSVMSINITKLITREIRNTDNDLKNIMEIFINGISRKG